MRRCAGAFARRLRMTQYVYAARFRAGVRLYVAGAGGRGRVGRQERRRAERREAAQVWACAATASPVGREAAGTRPAPGRSR